MPLPSRLYAGLILSQWHDGLEAEPQAARDIEQVLAAQDQLEDGERLSNMVFMGMGEPLANFNALSEAIRRLTNKHWGLGWSPRRITVSTAGLASRMKEVAPLGVNLAVSLNATTDEQRARLMPAVNGMASLKTLLLACRRYPLAPHRRLTFEYVLLAGVNDGEADALRLVKLIRGITCKVNLIPFNPFPAVPSAGRPTSTSWRSNRSCARPASTSSSGKVAAATCWAPADNSGISLLLASEP